MKQALALLLLLALLIGCTPQAPADLGSPAGDAGETGPAVPSGEQIDAAEKEMAALADGRWTEYSAVWSAETGTLTLSATAGPDADGDAVKAYCRLLDDLAARHLPGVKLSAAVYFQSGAKIECK
jgi:hypothetical protein